jgi:hypothetical protein
MRLYLSFVDWAFNKHHLVKVGAGMPMSGTVIFVCLVLTLHHSLTVQAVSVAAFPSVHISSLKLKGFFKRFL